MSVRARITADARLVPMSEGVSYGLNYRSPGSVMICTIPVGYADGLKRALSGRDGRSSCRGSRFPQVGNICMDQCMFEVDLRTSPTLRRVEPHVGDVVTIIGVARRLLRVRGRPGAPGGHHPARDYHRLLAPHAALLELGGEP